MPETPLVSIVVPCYNHGAFLYDAIESVEHSAENSPYELIIVDDGSTDFRTIEVLQQLGSQGYTVIHQSNQGLAAARNNGIAVASGKYIIPLDSDNKLHPNYIVKATQIMEGNSEIDIVYGNPMFFGDEEGLKSVGDFDFKNMLQHNFIDACAVFKRGVWQAVNGYDGTMPAMGNEDWEFWIHSFLKGYKFYYLNDICFYYRVLQGSMSALTTRPSYELNKTYIYNKHSYQIIKHLIDYSTCSIKAIKEEARRDKWLLNYILNNRLKAIVKLGLGYKF